MGPENLLLAYGIMYFYFWVWFIISAKIQVWDYNIQKVIGLTCSICKTGFDFYYCSGTIFFTLLSTSVSIWRKKYIEILILQKSHNLNISRHLNWIVYSLQKFSITVLYCWCSKSHFEWTILIDEEVKS